MKIKGKSDLILNTLRRMSRVASDIHHNYRLVANNILEVYAQGSSIYCKCVLTEIEVLEKGECLLPITALALIPGHKNITMETNKDEAIIKSGRTKISIKLNYKEPDAIPIIKEDVKWSKQKHDRLPEISYACNPELNYTSAIWFMNGGALASNGINTATYRHEETLPIHKLGLDAGLLSRFGYEGDVFVGENNGSIWLGNDLGYAVMPSTTLLMPEILNQFVEVTEERLASFFVVNMDELKLDLQSITKLSEHNDKYLCVIQANGDNLNIIPQGNAIGSGDYNFTVLESMNSMMVAVNPKALGKAINACGKGTKTLGIYEVPGFSAMLTILDNEITHFITPMIM